MLTSSLVSFPGQKNQIRQLVQLLEAHRIVFETVDCSDEENKARRDMYFEVSQVRANYPQVFLETPTATTYIGSFAEIEVRVCPSIGATSASGCFLHRMCSRAASVCLSVNATAATE